MTKGKMWKRAGGKSKTTPMSALNVNMVRTAESDKTDLKYPKSIQTFSNADNTNRVHPTQKQLDLIRWLIRTYSNENDLILDNTSGSGTLAVGCELENRRWICIEKEREYCDVTINRLKEL